MAYLKMTLKDNQFGECVFTFSNSIGDTIRNRLKEDMELQYLQRREVSHQDRTTIYLKNVPEYIRTAYQKGAVQTFINTGGKLNHN